MKNKIHFFLIIAGSLLLLYSCKAYEEGTIAKARWELDAYGCSNEPNRYVISGTNSGSYYFYRETDNEPNSSTYKNARWTRDATKDYFCENPDTNVPNWTETGHGCSTVADYYVEPNAGETAQYYFRKEKDMNPNSEYYNQERWMRIPEKDGSCSGNDTSANWVEINWGCSASYEGYTQPVGGEERLYYFQQERDLNPLSPSYQTTRWVRNISKDALCNSSGGDYTPDFGAPYIPGEGEYRQGYNNFHKFELYGSRLFAAEFGYGGIKEYINGEWRLPTGLTAQEMEANIYYPRIKAGANGNFYVGCTKGVYYQTGNDIYYGGRSGPLWTELHDMAGGMGGSNTNFFVSSGVSNAAAFRGIYKWDETQKMFKPTNMNSGCSYSIEALNETEVFFGSHEQAVPDTKNYYRFGVRRYNGSSIVETNLQTGMFNVASFDGKMFAATSYVINGIPWGVYVWNGNAFDQLHQLHGTLKVTGGKLYLLSSENVYEWNGSSFVVFQNERFDDIVVHDNITYLISMAGIKYLKNGSWNELPNIKGTTSISSPHGLFIGGPNGIYQLRIKN